MTGVVIVGAGTAGVTAAMTLRTAGYRGPVTLIGAEPGAPYRRTALTKDLLAADLAEERIALQKPHTWDDRAITLRTGVAVTAVDPDRFTVTCDDGVEIPYDALVLATGGVAARPAWLKPETPTLRTLPEALAVRDAIRAGRRLTVIGGGLIGLETAASAAAHGAEVDVVEAAEELLGRVAPAPVGRWLRRLHETNGVRIRTGIGVVEAAPDRAVLADGTVLPGPVVAAVGMRPDVALATAAGAVTTTAGITVDASFATSVPGVYAAGDAAATPDPSTGEPVPGGHWFGATDQGRAAALAVLADLDDGVAPPLREVPRAWTIQYGVNVQFVGRPVDADSDADSDVDPMRSVEIDGSLDDADATVRVLACGALVGAVTVGRPAAARECRAEIAARLGSTV